MIANDNPNVLHKPNCAVIAGLHLEIARNIQYQWYTQVEDIFPSLQPIQEKDQEYQKMPFFPLKYALLSLMKPLADSGKLPAPHRCGLLLNAHDAVYPEIKRCIAAIDKGNMRIRPHLAIAVEGSFPTSQAATELRILGPATTLANEFGGLQAIGWSMNLLHDKSADVMLVGEVFRNPTDTAQFCGSVTTAILTLANRSPWLPVGILTNWGWAKAHLPAVKGKTLKDLLEWLYREKEVNSFVSLDMKCPIMFTNTTLVTEEVSDE
jgi:hypothetical protein